ncbi:N-acetylglucosamine-6-phosphate deacetylase [Mesobacillus zeae]|uniref:N-acetylglucosamine-6-phosphate deacetylase n=1 Tax=Mesobacillus zeae TaxID=1917180 RepID=A0A398BFD4_9BACI|nr:N-acetylglucosamine-6-phosphate deacetylase [Mesobacillus zeae]RID86306.1 N-acetylglucosamine-6-phosphate deacetylase [Mesobacillus zeae]
MHNSSSILLKNAVIYTEDKVIEQGFLQIKDGKIAAVGTMEKLSELPTGEDYETVDLSDKSKVIPGFIDLHIHGANGADTMDASDDAITKIASSLPREGTTSFLATTITQDKASLSKALAIAGKYINKRQADGNAEVLGIHLEGPFINPGKAGAQPVQHIIQPDKLQFEKWLDESEGTISLVTMAPEQPGGVELVRFLKEKGIVASVGHSNATFDQVGEYINDGLSHVTHLFNQMRGLHHREPGVAGAAYLKDELKVELIADGIHVDREMVKVSYRQITSDRMILISDAMRAKFLPDGEYELGGQKVFVEEGKALLEDGTLAGSVLTLDAAFRNIIRFTGCSIADAVRMSSENPARQIGVLNSKGTLRQGKDADIVILDENLEVQMTFCRGRLAFQREA